MHSLRKSLTIAKPMSNSSTPCSIICKASGAARLDGERLRRDFDPVAHRFKMTCKIGAAAGQPREADEQSQSAPTIGSTPCLDNVLSMIGRRQNRQAFIQSRQGAEEALCGVRPACRHGILC